MDDGKLALDMLGVDHTCNFDKIGHRSKVSTIKDAPWNNCLKETITVWLECSICGRSLTSEELIERVNTGDLVIALANKRRERLGL